MPNLQFKNKRIIDAKNYKTLNEVYITQMAIGATLGFGEEYNTAEHFLAECGDGDIEDGQVELWDIVEASNPDHVLYDCWCYLVDTANVFHAGTVQETGVGMCQFSFDDHTNTEEGRNLAQDLQTAFDEMSRTQG